MAGTEEREGGGGERWCGHGGAQEGAKTIERSEGFHFIGWGREPGMGEVGMAAEKLAGGHGKRPGLARAFRVIKSTNQGVIKGEREGRERGLIPPNQFWN